MEVPKRETMEHANKPGMSGLDSDAVAGYLKENPAFFEQYADLIAEIFVPHPHGGHAISKTGCAS